jgi:hypothetical protein
MDGGELAATGRLGRSSMVAGTASGGAPALGMAPTVALTAGTTPPSGSLMREGLTRWGDDASSGDCDGWGLDGNDTG